MLVTLRALIGPFMKLFVQKAYTGDMLRRGGGAYGHAGAIINLFFHQYFHVKIKINVNVTNIKINK